MRLLPARRVLCHCGSARSAVSSRRIDRTLRSAFALLVLTAAVAAAAPSAWAASSVEAVAFQAAAGDDADARPADSEKSAKAPPLPTLAVATFFVVALGLVLRWAAGRERIGRE